MRWWSGPAGPGSASVMRSRRGASPTASLERGRIGETWRTQRWNLFRMNTPNLHTVMPGTAIPATIPAGR